LSRQADPDLWQLSVTLPLPECESFEQLFEDHALTVSLKEVVEDGSLWLQEIIFEGEPAKDLLDQINPDIPYELNAVIPRDWVSESQKLLPPVDAGRFYIHGSHDAPHKTISRHDLIIDAGRAFGTGLHETTYGCLLALHDIHKARKIHNPLDLGCGSGVLALAIAKAWNIPVTASDIDPDAVLVTRENARNNRLSPLVTAVQAAGLNSRALRTKAPFDLIVANILARPLVDMAADIESALSDTGILVLSGLLAHQEVLVRNSYRQQGMHLKKRYVNNNWSALILARQ
jgi:ribosomal protein L11 methyltransferase